MCGTRISIRKELVNRPDVISVGLVWDSEHPTLTLIRSVFQLIQTTIQLDEVGRLVVWQSRAQRTNFSYLPTGV